MKKDDIREEDLVEEVKFEIDKNAFSGPFKCHGMRTRLISKKIDVNGNVFPYSAWKCRKCKKEFLDSDQAKKLEAIWTIEKMLKGNILSMKRSINYDGKMFFLRFPKELTKEWKKGQYADIKFIDANKFIVEVK